MLRWGGLGTLLLTATARGGAKPRVADLEAHAVTVFRQGDTNRDLQLDATELEAIIEAQSGKPLDGSKLDALMLRMDSDSSGTVSMNTFPPYWPRHISAVHIILQGGACVRR